MLMDVAFHLRAGIQEDPETGSFVAYCPALDIDAVGADVDDAASAMQEAATKYLELCWARGQFESLMQQCRFHPDDDPARLADARAAEVVSMQEGAFTTIVDIDVSLSLIGERLARHAGPAPDFSSRPQARP
jgi:predicted RNase H-like HicB family nuclease